MKKCSLKQFNRMAITRAKKFCEQSGKSSRVCFFWATEEILKSYEITNQSTEHEPDEIFFPE